MIPAPRIRSTAAAAEVTEAAGVRGVAGVGGAAGVGEIAGAGGGVEVSGAGGVGEAGIGAAVSGVTATVWAVGRAELGEAPRWFPESAGRAGRLLWADLLEGVVFGRADDGTAAPLTAFPGETVSALIPLRDGTTAVALHRRIALLDDAGVWFDTVEVPRLPPGYRFSDATAGPSGHLWLGVVAAGPSAEPDLGRLLRVRRDGTIVARDALGFSNGIGFTADGRRLLLIDSAAGTITGIDHDPATGELGAAETLFRVDDDLGLPPGAALDGLAVDAHDRIWVAVFGGGAVLCIDGGRVVDRLEVPARRVSSCAFGPDHTLYITTARVEAPGDELAAWPLSGSVFSASTGCAGGPIWEGDTFR